MKFANWAISFLTAAAVFICLDVILLFTANLVARDLDTYVLGLFIVSIGFITGGLLTLFLEVTMATTILKFKSNSIFQNHD
jgi:hypothetical protein